MINSRYNMFSMLMHDYNKHESLHEHSVKWLLGTRITMFYYDNSKITADKIFDANT